MTADFIKDILSIPLSLETVFQWTVQINSQNTKIIK